MSTASEEGQRRGRFPRGTRQADPTLWNMGSETASKFENRARSTRRRSHLAGRLQVNPLGVLLSGKGPRFRNWALGVWKQGSVIPSSLREDSPAIQISVDSRAEILPRYRTKLARAADHRY